MENFFFFLIGGTTIVILILIFDSHQRRTKKKVLKLATNVQPLFLQRSAELKLNTLQTLLYGNITNPATGGQVSMNENSRQIIASQLDELLVRYNGGSITLKAFQNKLTQLLNTVHELKGH
jgi:hypothetical protein